MSKPNKKLKHTCSNVKYLFLQIKQTLSFSVCLKQKPNFLFCSEKQINSTLNASIAFAQQNIFTPNNPKAGLGNSSHRKKTATKINPTL